MTYLLLYISGVHPEYIQGTMEEINEQLKERWLSGDIDHDDWDHYDNWQLLCIEDNQVTEVVVFENTSVPRFTV